MLQFLDNTEDIGEVDRLGVKKVRLTLLLDESTDNICQLTYWPIFFSFNSHFLAFLQKIMSFELAFLYI